MMQRPAPPFPAHVSRTLAGLLALGLSGGAGAATELAALPSDLTQLSLEDLLSIEVTSVSKRAEPVSQAAAAIFVLTGEDIRRSGARSIAEALRLVPGLHVARTDVQTQTYAISARGFNNGLADKLEVLLDGRSVYSPLFSGVFWDTLDTFLPDIDRIEVIRGPGAALWGANAVNGVINIVTRPASETTGLRAIGLGGTEERAFGGVRGGWRLGEAGHMRAYGQALDRGAGRLPNGADAADTLRMQQGGFRADWKGSPRRSYTLMGDLFQANRGSPFGEMDMNGANLLGRWNFQQSERSELGLKAYYDYYRRAYPRVYEETRRTVDLDFEHHLRLGGSQELVYGLGYRNTRDHTEGGGRAFTFDPAARSLDTWSAFVQDQIGLGGGGSLTLGSKIEHNDYTGIELQPSLRLGWQLRERLFTWAALSRAVRTPNRLNSDLTVFSTFRVGNPEIDSEKLVAYEWGLRFWTENRFSADLALFYNDYREILGSAPGPSPFGHYANNVEGSTQGGELNLNWHPHRALELRAFYSYLDMDMVPADGGTDSGTPRTLDGSNPRHIAGVAGNWQPFHRFTANALLRHVAEMPTSPIPAYTDLNLRLGWRLLPQLELSLVGNNLLDAQHPEFGIANVKPLEAQRSALLLLDWSWD